MYCIGGRCRRFGVLNRKVSIIMHTPNALYLVHWYDEWDDICLNVSSANNNENVSW
jgi:hypothetical protein